MPVNPYRYWVPTEIWASTGYIGILGDPCGHCPSRVDIRVDMEGALVHRCQNIGFGLGASLEGILNVSRASTAVRLA